MNIYWVRYNSAEDSGGDRGGALAPSGDRLDAQRFAALFAEHHRTLWTIAASVQGDRTHAYDVVQEAAMVAITKLNEFDPATSFPSWMGQIVRYTALNEGRKQQRHRARGTGEETLDVAAFIQGGQTGGHVVALVGSRAEGSADAALARAIASLDEKMRTCLLLRTVQNLPYAAIATTLQMPEGTVMSHVHRAKALLREQLAGHEGFAEHADRHQPIDAKGGTL